MSQGDAIKSGGRKSKEAGGVATLLSEGATIGEFVLENGAFEGSTEAEFHNGVCP
jgi:hypothetical protein